MTPGAQVVNGSSHQSLAGSWFAHDEHGRGAGSREANLLEQTSMRRARADQGLASECLMEPLPQLHEADAKLVSWRIGHAGRCARLSHLAEHSDQRTAVVAKQRDSTLRQRRSPLAWRMTVKLPEGWPATASGGGTKLAATSAGSPDSVGPYAAQFGPEQLGRMPCQSFPAQLTQVTRSVDRAKTSAPRLLPELVRLERRNAWSRHGKWFNLEQKENEDSDQPLDRSRPGSRCRQF